MARETTDLAAKRYAQAAFELAAQQGNLTQWTNAIDEIARFMSDPAVAGVLENTRADQQAKLQLIDAALNELPPLPLNLAKLLVHKKRTNLAGDIAIEFRRLAEQREGISRVRARTAVPLSDAEREALTQRLRQQTGRNIILETEVDPQLLGGVVVQIGDRLIDASTRAKLESLRQSLQGAI
ncbi:MAG TPA: F0F1 ATP synthase subunit delta [Dehalococcoidia bacterium]|nr:F0F1 ATP synthase subunit delta [Dehalococcoidia bacterium]